MGLFRDDEGRDKKYEEVEVSIDRERVKKTGTLENKSALNRPVRVEKRTR